MIGPWDGSTPPSYPTAQFNAKPSSWDAAANSKPAPALGGAPTGGSRIDKWAGGGPAAVAQPPAAVGAAVDPRGPGRWREDERDKGLANRQADHIASLGFFGRS